MRDFMAGWLATGETFIDFLLDAEWVPYIALMGVWLAAGLLAALVVS